MSELYEKLHSTLPFCKLNSAGTEINIRCHTCGDSVKDPYKGHVYIQNYSPYKHYCQKCQTSGVVNKEFLEALQCDSYSLISNIQKEYAAYQKKIKIKYGDTLAFLNSKKIIFSKPICKNDYNKKEYIENRLGVKIDDNDIIKYKMIFSIKKFLKDNNINIIEKSQNNKDFLRKIETLERHCIGFLSTDKSTIIFRSMDKTKTGYRYHNFTIFPELDSKKTYTIANELDLTSKLFTVYITEGVMDLLGVYNNITDKQLDNHTIYIANAGKSFIVTSNLLKRMSILNANINIYSDSDVDIKFYKDLIKVDPFYEMNGINIYYNNRGKDFGVCKNEIELSNEIQL